MASKRLTAGNEKGLQYQEFHFGDKKRVGEWVSDAGGAISSSDSGGSDNTGSGTALLPGPSISSYRQPSASRPLFILLRIDSLLVMNLFKCSPGVRITQII